MKVRIVRLEGFSELEHVGLENFKQLGFVMKRFFTATVLMFFLFLWIFPLNPGFALRSSAQKTETIEQENFEKNKSQASKSASSAVQKNKVEKVTENEKTKEASRAIRPAAHKLMPGEKYPTR